MIDSARIKELREKVTAQNLELIYDDGFWADLLAALDELERARPVLEAISIEQGDDEFDISWAQVRNEVIRYRRAALDLKAKMEGRKP